MDDHDIARLLANAEEILRQEDERADAEEDRELLQLEAEARAQISAVLNRAEQIKKLNRTGRLGRQSAELLEMLYDKMEAFVRVCGGEVPIEARRPEHGAR
jgi:hypothetical protein